MENCLAEKGKDLREHTKKSKNKRLKQRQCRTKLMALMAEIIELKKGIDTLTEDCTPKNYIDKIFVENLSKHTISFL